VATALCASSAISPATAEVGVTFAPERQGTGLATEAPTAVITKLFVHHDVHRVYAQADDRNRAVHRLVERLGLGPAAAWDGRIGAVRRERSYAWKAPPRAACSEPRRFVGQRSERPLAVVARATYVIAAERPVT
jgi:RimJ/RimL family protein N-acetyltransferase